MPELGLLRFGPYKQSLYGPALAMTGDYLSAGTTRGTVSRIKGDP